MVAANGAAYAGTTGGVFQTTDNGATWKNLNTGLSDVNTSQFAVTNSIQQLWYLNDVLYALNVNGSLFHWIGGRWVNILPETKVYDLEFFEGSYYFVSISRDPFSGKNKYEVHRLANFSSTPELVLELGIYHFFVMDAIAHAGSGLVFSSWNSIHFYNGALENISPKDHMLAPTSVAAFGKNDIWLVDYHEDFPSTKNPTQSLYHYDGTQWNVMDVTAGVPFLAKHLFVVDNALYVYGFDQGAEVAARLAKRNTTFGSSWEDTRGYTETTVPVILGIVGSSPLNYLYYGEDFIRHSVFNNGYANEHRESGIFNGGVSQIEMLDDKVYIKSEDRVIKSYNAITGTQEETLGYLGSFPKMIKEDQTLLFGYRSEDDEQLMFRYKEEGAFNWTQEQLTYYNGIVAGFNGSAIDFSDYNRDINGRSYYTYYTDIKEVRKQNFPYQDTSRIEGIWRYDNSIHAVASYFEITDHDNGFTISFSYLPQTVIYQNKNGIWNRYPFYYESGYRYEYGGMTYHEGATYLTLHSRISNASFPKTKIEMYDGEAYKPVVALPHHLENLRFEGDRWLATYNGTLHWSTNLQSWNPMELEGIPEAADVYILKTLNGVTYAGTKGNGIFYKRGSFTSVTEGVSQPLEFEMYPNPAKGKVTLSSGKMDIQHVEIFNVSGRLVKTLNPSAIQSVVRIDISDLDAGHYLVRINRELGNTAQSLIIQ